MIRYLKEEHETMNLYFSSDRQCEKCKICGYEDDVIWSYDTDKPIQDTLQSLFDLIVNNGDNGGIIYTGDLELLQNELNFDLDIFNKFVELLKIKDKFKKIKFEYMCVRDELQYQIIEIKNKKGARNERN